MQQYGPYTVDELGRILLPLVVRQALGIDSTTKLIMYVRDDGCIVLKPAGDEQSAENVQSGAGHGGSGPMFFF